MDCMICNRESQGLWARIRHSPVGLIRCRSCGARYRERSPYSWILYSLALVAPVPIFVYGVSINAWWPITTFLIQLAAANCALPIKLVEGDRQGERHNQPDTSTLSVGARKHTAGEKPNGPNSQGF